ncbi:MAG: PLDc N-terminal domain-containing protein [Bilophila wadsworthia]
MLYISLLLALLAVACLIFVPNTVILLSFVAIMHGFAVYSACHALLHKRDSRAALGWIAIILFMPPVGLPLYWLFGIARIDSQAVRLMEKAAQKVMGGLVDLHGKSLTEKPEGFIDKDEVPHAWHYLVNPGSSITGRCMLEGNDLTVLHNGEAAYPVMLKAISEAKERVFLSSFIFGYDEVGKSFAAALRAAAERGCDVRLLMDGVGSFHCGRAGANARPGRQARLLPAAAPHPAPVFHQPADAPQSLICDSETGFTGGMNISQNHSPT